MMLKAPELNHLTNVWDVDKMRVMDRAGKWVEQIKVQRDVARE
jgi:hypothetical protein